MGPDCRTGEYEAVFSGLSRWYSPEPSSLVTISG